MTAFRLTLQGEDLGRFDPEAMPNSEIYLLENQFGITWSEFVEGLGKLRAASVDALIWLMSHRKGRPIEKSQIVWTPADIKEGLTAEDEPENPTEAVSGTADASTSVPSLTSAT